MYVYLRIKNRKMMLRLPSEVLREKAKKISTFNLLIEVLREDKSQAAVFRLLFDKYKYQPEGLCNYEVEEELRMSQSVVANSLAKLRKKGLIHTKKGEGKEIRKVYNYLTPRTFEVMSNLNIEPLRLESK